MKLERFDPKFRLAGGINLPKILSCQCSDGKRRKQLLKVNDKMFGDNTLVAKLLYSCIWKEKLSKRSITF